jgi:hypothetical protein
MGADVARCKALDATPSWTTITERPRIVKDRLASVSVRARSDAGSEIAESWSQTDLAGHFGDLEPTVTCLKSADIGMGRKGLYKEFETRS